MDPVKVRNVERRNTQGECGQPIGRMVIKVEGIKEFQTIVFRCTKLPLHRDACAFEGTELIVQRKRL